MTDYASLDRLLTRTLALTRRPVAVALLDQQPAGVTIPAAMAGSIADSLGCVGNRVYADLPADEFYSVVPGAHLRAVATELTTIASANAALKTCHERRLTLRMSPAL